MASLIASVVLLLILGQETRKVRSVKAGVHPNLSAILRGLKKRYRRKKIVVGTPPGERDIRIKPKFSGGKTGFGYTPALTMITNIRTKVMSTVDVSVSDQLEYRPLYLCKIVDFKRSIHRDLS